MQNYILNNFNFLVGRITLGNILTDIHVGSTTYALTDKRNEIFLEHNSGNTYYFRDDCVDLAKYYIDNHQSFYCY